MDNTAMDWILSGLAGAIAFAGLWMLIAGVREMGDKS
jgi:hypothetical protein